MWKFVCFFIEINHKIPHLELRIMSGGPPRDCGHFLMAEPDKFASNFFLQKPNPDLRPRIIKLVHIFLK